MIRRSLIRAAGVAIAAFTARALGQTRTKGTELPGQQLAFLDLAAQRTFDLTKTQIVGIYDGRLVPILVGSNLTLNRDPLGTLTLSGMANPTPPPTLTLGLRAASTDGIKWTITLSGGQAIGVGQSIRAVYRNGIRQALAVDYNITTGDPTSITIILYPNKPSWNVDDIVQFDLQ